MGMVYRKGWEMGCVGGKLEAIHDRVDYWSLVVPWQQVEASNPRGKNAL